MTINGRYDYGDCVMCGYLGTVELHHIIPKRYRTKTDVKAKLIYDYYDNKVKVAKLNVKIEDIMIRLCHKCHKKIHPENWVFHRNEKVLNG